MVMDLRRLTPEFAVAPQIEPEDLAEAAAMGFRTLINNRPDEEIEDQLQSAAMAKAAAEAGLAYHHLPYYPGMLTEELADAFSEVMKTAEGPVLAYCRSGTRSSHLWALDQAGQMPTDEILRRAAEWGYDHSGLAPLIEARSNS